MEQQANGSLRLVMTGIALATSLTLGASALGQQQQCQRAPSRHEDKEAAAAAAADQHRRPDGQDSQRSDRAPEHGELRGGASRRSPRCKLDKLSPYERGKVEQILFNIAYSQDQLRRGARPPAEGHRLRRFERAKKSTQARYQTAQLFMQEEKWKEGAAALEEWFKTRDESELRRVLPARGCLLPAGRLRKGACRRRRKPSSSWTSRNENWLQLVSALYLQREEYKEAIPHSAAARLRSAREEDLLDAAVVGLRPDGGLSERARDHAARVLGAVS